MGHHRTQAELEKNILRNQAEGIQNATQLSITHPSRTQKSQTSISYNEVYISKKLYFIVHLSIS